MGPPFIALSRPEAGRDVEPPPARTQDLLAAAGWSLALSHQGLFLWGRRERPLRLSVTGEVVILGRWTGGREALERGGVSDVSVPERRARALVASGWGAYLALLRDPLAGRWHVLRDPSGALEAFTWRIGPYEVLASGLEDVPGPLRPHRLALDWEVIADFLRRPVAQVGRVALRDLTGVAPGALQPLGGGAETLVWRPSDFLPREPLVHPDWPERLADTVQGVVAEMASSYDRLVVETSGGLDSSIVAAGLGQAGLGPRVGAALHYVGDRPESDERGWAEPLVRRYALPLAALTLSSGPVDPERDFAELARDVRPPFAALDADRDRETAELIVQLGAEALVTGKGGDAVFYQMPTAAVLADLWRALGLRALAHPRQLEVARWLRRSVWSLWREAWRPPRPDPLRGALGRLAGPALLTAPAEAAHPWLADLAGVPPGKRAQIEALAGSQLALGRHRRGAAADLVQPLLAQPVMELCLSIPSWELVRGGRDRGLAREAFAGRLPEAVVRRRSKGDLTSHYARRTGVSAAVLREHLLGGVLADAGLLDRAETEAALSPDSLIWRADGIDLIGVAAVESWVRYWQTQVPDAPEAGRYRPPSRDL